MKKNKTIIILAVVAALAAGIFLFYKFYPRPLTRPGAQEIKLDRDLEPVGLSQEDLRELENAGISAPPSGADPKSSALLRVRISDNLSEIEADVLNTDLSGIDEELSDIGKDLSGL